MKRSEFFQTLTFSTLGATLIHKQSFALLMNPLHTPDIFYVGCYTSNPLEGIATGRFDPGDGSIQLTDVCRGVENPSFLIFDHKREFIYAVNETDNFGGKNSGSVSAFLRNEKSGQLTFLNSQSSMGAHPCHLTIDRTGKFILVANYTGGNVAVLPILTDGQLGEPVAMVQHTGYVLNDGTKISPHAHSVNLSPDNRFAFVCDLGIDRIMAYEFDQITGKLSAADRPWFQAARGAGPRHFTFSPDGKNAFSLNELDSTITFFSYDQNQGILDELHTVTTLPDGYKAENYCADVHVHPNGKFVYASNRGHNSIAVFSVNPVAGNLSLIQHQSTLGKFPRNFAIHTSGRFLLAANQHSDSIHVFTLDESTGKLIDTGNTLIMTNPVCILL